MPTLLCLLAVYSGWRATRALIDTLRRLQRSNKDFVFF